MKFRDTPPPKSDSTYPQGFDAIAEAIIRGQRPFVDLEDNLPDPEMDFAPLKTRLLPPRGNVPFPKPPQTLYVENEHWMRFRLANHPELCHLAACLIMLSRRVPFPTEMQDLWFRLWDEEAAFLIEHLDIRWQISALRTFGSYGRNELERRLGREMFLATGMMKLADTERSFSGLAAHEHFPLGKRKDRPVSLGQEPYSPARGDLDQQIIYQLWETVDALDGSSAGLLGRAVLDQINACPRTVFRRLMVIRDKFRRAQARRAAADQKSL